MASRYRTGDRSEALMASLEIVDLAKKVPSPEDLEKAEHLSVMLVTSKSVKKQAIVELVRLVALIRNAHSIMYSTKRSSYLNGPETR